MFLCDMGIIVAFKLKYMIHYDFLFKKFEKCCILKVFEYFFDYSNRYSKCIKNIYIYPYT